MSKVVMNVDTESGLVECSVNGKTVDNFCYGSVWCGKNYDGEMKANVSIETAPIKDEAGATWTCRIYAAKSEEGIKALAGRGEFLTPDLVVIKTTAEQKFGEDLKKLMGKK